MGRVIDASAAGCVGVDEPEYDLYARDEMNLAEFPITLLSDRSPPGLTMLTREIQARDERTGALLARKVTVTGSEVYGLPTAQDSLVLLGLIYLTKRANNFQDRRVAFTRSSLIRVLEWPDTGPSYDRIRVSLCRWANVFVLYENSWWERPRQAYSTRGFGIIDDFELIDGARARRPGEGPPASTFSWNEVFFRSLEDGFVRGLDLKTVLRLRHPSSRQMYRYLAKHFYRTPSLTLDLRSFACEHIGLDRGYKDNGKLKEKLQPALDELESIGFLEPMPRHQRYTKAGPGRWLIALTRKTTTPAPPAALTATVSAPNHPLESSPSAPSSAAVAVLTSRGVTPATASALVSAFSESHVRVKVEAFDWLLSRGDRRVSKNPAGYLTESIRKDYAPPKGFEPLADRQAREATNNRSQRLLETVRLEAESTQAARQAAEETAVRAFRASLTAENLERLEDEALADPSLNFLADQVRRHRADPERFEHCRRLLIDALILRRLGLLDA